MSERVDICQPARSMSVDFTFFKNLALDILVCDSGYFIAVWKSL